MALWLRYSLAISFILGQVFLGLSGTRLLRNNYAGPYKMKIEDFIACENSESMATTLYITCDDWSKETKECRHGVGNWTVRKDLTDKKPYPGSVILNQWRDREWKKDGIVMKFPNGFQAVHDHLGEIYRLIFKGNTTVPKGVYKVSIPLAFNFKSIPVFPYGRWKATMTGLDHVPGNKEFFCYIFMVNIVPK